MRWFLKLQVNNIHLSTLGTLMCTVFGSNRAFILFLLFSTLSRNSFYFCFYSFRCSNFFVYILLLWTVKMVDGMKFGAENTPRKCQVVYSQHIDVAVSRFIEYEIVRSMRYIAFAILRCSSLPQSLSFSFIWWFVDVIWFKMSPQ